MTETPENISGLGKFLARQLESDKIRTWRLAFFLILIVILVLNIFIRNEHPHFGIDRYPFFWAAFGLIVGVAMVFLVKKIIQPLIKKPEDYYGDL
jgi:TRAP-type C4-dicarboxylate transport system permease small subunit